MKLQYASIRPLGSVNLMVLKLRCHGLLRLCVRFGEGVGGEDICVSSSFVCVGMLLVDIVLIVEEVGMLDVGEVVAVDVVGGEEEVVLLVIIEARRDLSSVFSFLVSLRHFSSDSMCILNSTFNEDNLAIFCNNSWFSVIIPFVLSSRSVMYSFLRCLESAADCLFFNNLSCLFRVLSSSDLNSTLSLLRSPAAWISDAEAANNSSFSVGLKISMRTNHQATRRVQRSSK